MSKIDIEALYELMGDWTRVRQALLTEDQDVRSKRQDAKVVDLAEKAAQHAMYIEWYAISLGGFVIVIPVEEGYVDRHQ